MKTLILYLINLIIGTLINKIKPLYLTIKYRYLLHIYSLIYNILSNILLLIIEIIYRIIEIILEIIRYLLKMFLVSDYNLVYEGISFKKNPVDYIRYIITLNLEILKGFLNYIKIGLIKF